MIDERFKSGDDDDENDGPDSVFKITKKAISIQRVVIQLNSGVSHDSSKYFDLIQALYTFDPNDDVTLLLGGYGGSVDTGMQLIHAMKNSPAHVKVVVHAPCYSMHALLAISGSVLQMHPRTFLMFHNYSGGHAGKGGELAMAVKQYERHARELLNYVAAPFLSKKEIDRLCTDQDVYVHESDKDIEKRIKRHFSK